MLFGEGKNFVRVGWTGVGSWKTDQVVNRYFVVFVVVVIQESCLIDREAAAVDNSVSVCVRCNLNWEKLELRLASPRSCQALEWNWNWKRSERAENGGARIFLTLNALAIFVSFFERKANVTDGFGGNLRSIDGSILLIREWKSGPNGPERVRED